MSKLIASALLLTLLLVSGCTDRGNNTAPEYNGNSGPLILNHVFFWELLVQVKNTYQQSFAKAYVPNVGIWGTPPNYTPDRQLPLLILLPPQGGDQNYYFNHGLAQVANELLTEGLIEPMVIVTPSNDATFGGYWWSGNGGGAGNYDTLIGGTMVDWIWANAIGTNNPFDTSQAMTGIGGIGEGAYGAYRAAMKHPGRFGSISAIDGPLDFDGVDGASGLINLFDDVLNEQGILGHANYLNEFDSAGQYQLSRLFIGGALAFSPHDTLVRPIAILQANGYDIRTPDSVRFKIQGTAGLVDSIIQQDNREFDFHLPFDANGDPINEPDAPIWDLWMRNSLDKMYHAYHRSGENFNDVDMWFATAIQNDPLGYNKMTQAFIQLLRGYGYDPDVKFYDGYPGNPAYTDEYLNHLLRDMLIFHSNAFKRAQQNQGTPD